MEIILDLLIWMWCFGTIAICSHMWRLGGDGYSLVRNPGVPLVLAVSRWIIGWPVANDTVLLYIPVMWAMMRMFSYGVSSPVHKFWVWIFGSGGDGNNPTVELATRTTCGFFWTIPAAIFCIPSGIWTWYLPYVMLMSAAIGYIGATVKDVEISERLTGAAVAMSIII